MKFTEIHYVLNVCINFALDTVISIDCEVQLSVSVRVEHSSKDRIIPLGMSRVLMF